MNDKCRRPSLEEHMFELPAFAVHQNVARFEVTMNHVARMDEIRCVQQLIHDVPLVDVFEYCTAFNHIMQIALHEFKR